MGAREDGRDNWDRPDITCGAQKVTNGCCRMRFERKRSGRKRTGGDCGTLKTTWTMCVLYGLPSFRFELEVSQFRVLSSLLPG